MGVGPSPAIVFLDEMKAPLWYYTSFALRVSRRAFRSQTMAEKMKLGERIAAYRNRLEMSVESFAEKSGVSPSVDRKSVV